MKTNGIPFDWYRDAGWQVQFHIKARWRLFPFAELVPYIASTGTFLDIGCGHGSWVLFLAEKYPEARVIGFDPDHQKVVVARMAAQKSGLSNVQFDESLYQEKNQGRYNFITVIDVLYLIPYTEQERLLAGIAESLVPGGRVLLKDMNKQPRFKYLWNWLEEWVMVRLLKVTFGSKFYFRRSAEWEMLLRRNGLSVKTIRMDHHYLHPHILFIGEKT